jgi:hypothetical protein
MNQWTPSARAVLQHYLDQHRTRFAADGAEAEEVIADLRDHVEREAASLNLSVVTESDVRRILAQVDPSPLLPSPRHPAKPKTPHRLSKADPEKVGCGSSSEPFSAFYCLSEP